MREKRVRDKRQAGREVERRDGGLGDITATNVMGVGKEGREGGMEKVKEGGRVGGGGGREGETERRERKD